MRAGAEQKGDVSGVRARDRRAVTYSKGSVGDVFDSFLSGIFRVTFGEKLAPGLPSTTCVGWARHSD